MNEDIVSCRQCSHLTSRRDEREALAAYPTMFVQACAALPQRANLKSFPFMVTTCPDFHPIATEETPA